MLFPTIAAVAVALVLGSIWACTRSRWALLLSATWLSYAGYEFLMFTRVLCTGECNIRVDLLLIYPVLALVTLLGLGCALWQVARRRRADRSRNT